MFSGERREDSLETLVRGGGIVLAAFVFTLIIFLLFQQLMQNTQGRFKTLMTEAGAEERRASNTPMAQSPGYSPTSPTMPRLTAGYMPQRPPVSTYTPVLPPINPYTPSDAFTSNEERDQAVAALESLRTTVQIVRRYDSSSFWQAIPKADIGAAKADSNDPIQSIPLGAESGIENGTPTRLYATASGGAAAERQKVINRISDEAEALHSELSLVGHPDLFPEPVRNLAKTVAREARIYLSTVQQSLTQPDDRTEMQSLAREHLTRSEAALRELERATGSVPHYGGSGGLGN